LARLRTKVQRLRARLHNELRHRVHGKGWSWVRVAVRDGSRGWLQKGKCFAEFTAAGGDSTLLDLFSHYEAESMRRVRAATHPEVLRARRALRRKQTSPVALEVLYETVEGLALEGERDDLFTTRRTWRKDFSEDVSHLARKDGFNLADVRRALLVEGALVRAVGWRGPTVPTDQPGLVGELTDRLTLMVLAAFDGTPAKRRPPIRHVAAAARYRAELAIEIANHPGEGIPLLDRTGRRNRAKQPAAAGSLNREPLLPCGHPKGWAWAEHLGFKPPGCSVLFCPSCRVYFVEALPMIGQLCRFAPQ